MIFHEILIAVERAKVEILLNLPIFLGFTILDVSKTFMYEFHFFYLKEKDHGEKSKLLFTNTVLLTQVIKTENIHDKIFSNK